ncbi:MAG: uroporphyrinogen-III C-methyltransferase [Rickettsiales bacterium]|nr:uroporphyrinogen-III C-methyltransferase [Rickettsiales bacterium]
MKKHKVYIIGAGAGSKDYLTLKAFEILTSYPDVVIYDRLISEDVINLIPPNVEKIFAGKEPKFHHMKQGEINNEIINQVNLGKKVIRLKGGDPFIFGRGGEEILELKNANIEFEVIAGISAANLSASRFNIPLTFREISDGVIYLSGHSYDDNPPKIDYAYLAKASVTIVLYMSVGNIKIIAENFMQAGMDKNKNVAAVQSASLKEEKIIYGNISNIAQKIIESNISNPAIIIIGDVVKISENLNNI